jgi:SpoVK/Ycf46/Vps4 family AAA+-type ATPase
MFPWSPGVGKTTVSALYSEILKELGLLSKGHITTIRASDLIGKYVGHSEAKVTKALEHAQGGVLVIDDAHLLYQETSNGENHSDSFRQGVIDTLVANVSGSPGKDRCVILCGYTDKMERMFLKSNPGLARRFPLETALRFASYSNDELNQILKQKMDADSIVASEEAHKVARNMLSRMRTRPNFGNGGDVETLLCEAKLRQVSRLRLSNAEFATLSDQAPEATDFDLDFDRPTRAPIQASGAGFPVLDFPQLPPEDCLQLLSKLLSKLSISVSSSIMDRCGEHNAAVLKLLTQLTNSKGWASGRDVETLSNAVIELLFTRAGDSKDFCDSEQLRLSFEDLVDCLKAMLKDRGVVLTRLQDELNYADYARRQRLLEKV